MTNAERLRRGLPLKKPAVRSVFVTRAKDDQDKDNKDDKHKHDKNNGGKGGNRHGAVHHGFFDDGRGGHGGGASCSITTITETKTKTETHEACKSSTVTDFVCRYADQTGEILPLLVLR
jgi:hypothetical protein